MVIPAFSARRRTVSAKPRFSIFITKVMADPPSPQPKHLKFCRVWSTMKEGVFSLWNGQHAFQRDPALFRER